MTITAAERLAQLAGSSVEEMDARHSGTLVARATQKVERSAEFVRVSKLPRRDWSTNAEAQAAQITEAFKTPRGKWGLRPIQGAALYEIATFGGLFGPINVGGGKTLITFLAPEMAQSERPLLLVPAKLKEKTERDFRALRVQFNGPSYIRVLSYESLGRVQAAKVLEMYNPDLIVADEVHRLKNHRAAVTRRVSRYMADNPSTKFVALSGTITNRSLKDYSHIVAWCLPNTYFLPAKEDELSVWASALDEDKMAFNRPSPGAMFEWVRDRTEIGKDPLAAARKAYRERMTETPGVIATQGGALGTSLQIQAIRPADDAAIDEAFKTMRALWETPDGHPIADGIQMWRHCRELACGFYYRWNPRPPDIWLNPRRDWAAWCRETLKTNRRGLDSELAVVMAVDAGHYPIGEELLAKWRRVRPTFTPNTETVWLTDSILDLAAKWMDKHHHGIVWTEHKYFGLLLAALTGVPYYGRQGRDLSGRYIEDHPHGQPMIASVHSNAEGRNLQIGWNRNLIVSAPPTGKMWEQMMGRTHRPGQPADCVDVDVVANCLEQVAGFHQARRDSKFTQDTTGQDQKLCYADIDFPTLTDVNGYRGARWHK